MSTLLDMLSFSILVVAVSVFLGPFSGQHSVGSAVPTGTGGDSDTLINVTGVGVAERTCVSEPDVPSFELPDGVCRRRNDSCKHELVKLTNGKFIMCDTWTDGGGWIIVQRRKDFRPKGKGTKFFKSESYTDYRDGFGTRESNFWIGLETMHRLCPPQKPCEMRTDLMVQGDIEEFVKSKAVAFEGAWDNYRIHLEFDGKLGDGGPFEDHHGLGFASMGNPRNLSQSCVEKNGGWWHNEHCNSSSLNTDDDDHFTFSEIKLRRPGGI